MAVGSERSRRARLVLVPTPDSPAPRNPATHTAPRHPAGTYDSAEALPQRPEGPAIELLLDSGPIRLRFGLRQ
jgi:hypothetical protein